MCVCVITDLTEQSRLLTIRAFGSYDRLRSGDNLADLYYLIILFTVVCVYIFVGNSIAHYIMSHYVQFFFPHALDLKSSLGCVTAVIGPPVFA